jgi:hypothetical protein
MTTTAEVNEFTGKPEAKAASSSEDAIVVGTTFQIRSLKGHRVLTPVISQSELADEMFQLQTVAP